MSCVGFFWSHGFKVKPLGIDRLLERHLPSTRKLNIFFIFLYYFISLSFSSFFSYTYLEIQIHKNLICQFNGIG